MRYQAQSELWKLERVLKRPTKPMSPFRKPKALGRFRQIFPLTIFPDDLIVEEDRVIWKINKGPWVSELISIMATDIASLDSSTGPFFGHFHIKSLTGGPEILIDKLLRSDVTGARSLVEGIVIASRRGENYQKDNIEFERRYLISRGQIN